MTIIINMTKTVKYPSYFVTWGALYVSLTVNNNSSASVFLTLSVQNRTASRTEQPPKAISIKNIPNNDDLHIISFYFYPPGPRNNKMIWIWKVDNRWWISFRMYYKWDQCSRNKGMQWIFSTGKSRREQSSLKLSREMCFLSPFIYIFIYKYMFLIKLWMTIYI